MKLTAREHKALEGEIPNEPYNEEEWRRIMAMKSFEYIKYNIEREEKIIEELRGMTDHDEIMSAIEEGYCAYLNAKGELRGIQEKDYNDLGMKKFFKASKSKSMKSLTYAEWINENNLGEVYKEAYRQVYKDIDKSDLFEIQGIK